MRLGAYIAELKPGSQVAEAYGEHGRVRAPPPPLRVQPPLPQPLRGSGFVLLGHLARRAPGRVHRAGGPPVLGRHPGPPRVQEPSRPARPAVPRVRRRRAGPGRGPQPAPARPRPRPHAGRRRRRRPRRDRRRAPDRQAFRAPRRASSSTRATSSSMAVGTFEGARRHAASTATSCAIPARCRSCPCTPTAPSSWCASTAPPLDATAARDPRRQARRRGRAARADRRAGSWPRRSGWRPARSSCWPSS